MKNLCETRYKYIFIGSPEPYTACSKCEIVSLDSCMTFHVHLTVKMNCQVLYQPIQVIEFQSCKKIVLQWLTCRGGWSANKFRKSKIRKNVLHLWSFRKCGNLRICDLLTQYFLRFADQKLPHFRKFFIFHLTNIFLTCFNSNFY